MNTDADRLAEQTTLAYEFMETLHGQALDLIRDTETQLERAPEELQSLRFGGYRFATSRHSMSLRSPEPNVSTYYAVCFRHYPGRIRNTPLKGTVPPVAFLKVVLRERNLGHPEVRFGMFARVAKSAERGERQWPTKFDDLVNTLADQALGAPCRAMEGIVDRQYANGYFSIAIHGAGVGLAALPNSEAIANHIVDPLLEMYRTAEARQGGSK